MLMFEIDFIRVRHKIQMYARCCCVDGSANIATKNEWISKLCPVISISNAMYTGIPR